MNFTISGQFGVYRLNKPSIGISASLPRSTVSTNATTAEKGTQFMAENIEVKRSIGEGSFGEVFEGLLAEGSGNRRVVLKRVKARVQGAEYMGQMEHLLNVAVSQKAPDSCAPFIGYCEVNKDEATVKLTPGLWLLWEYQGSRTLWYYLHRRDCIQALSRDMGIPQHAVVPTVMHDILSCLKLMHEVGLVHRDVKPANLIFCENSRQFKLIDLGACADLRTGTNYVPDESILDPVYCAPEQYVLPTDAPHLAKTAFVTHLISQVWWHRYKPDRFDIYSTGLILLQLSVPSLRTERAIKSFRKMLAKCNYNFRRWRRLAALPPKETELLDANEFAGWELLEGMLRPRRIEQDDKGNVYWRNEDKAPRYDAAMGLSHKFLLGAMARSPGHIIEAETTGEFEETTFVDTLTSADPEESKSSVLAKATDMVRSWYYDLETKLKQQESATEKQRRKVAEMATKMKLGEVTRKQLETEQQRLQDEKTRLSEMEATAWQRVNQWQSIFTDDKSKEGSADSSKQATNTPASDSSKQGQKPSPGILGGLLESLNLKGKEWQEEQEEFDTIRKQKEEAALLFANYLTRAAMKANSCDSYEILVPHIPNIVLLDSLNQYERLDIYNSTKQQIQSKLEGIQKERDINFRQLMVEMRVSMETPYAKFQMQANQDKRYSAIPHEEQRKAMFHQYVGELQARGSPIEAEHEFRQLLTTLEISGESRWVEIKRKLFADKRMLALQEHRRRELFEEYRAMVAELEDARAQQAMAMVDAGSSTDKAPSSDVESSMEEMESYEALKSNFSSMEQRIRELENRLADQQRLLEARETLNRASNVAVNGNGNGNGNGAPSSTSANPLNNGVPINK